MKKRFLPFSLLLVIMVLGQSISIADNGGHYVPRTQGTASAERFMSDLRVNQHTGLIDPAWMLNAAQNLNTRDASDDPLYWLTMGPDNMGGQTTAILYDNRLNPNTGGSNGVVYIGSKGGGVYKSYNYGVTWHQVGKQSLMVSSLAQDAEGVIYVGTGDNGDAITYNGLSEMGYTNSFIGSGVYKIVNDEVSVLTSTVPSADDDTWSFVNDLAVVGNTLIAATDGGLMYSNDKGATWASALEDACDAVRVMSDNTLVVSSIGKIYIGTIDNLVCHSAASAQYGDGDTILALPTAAALLDIAISPSDAGTIYASGIAANGNHSGIYVSYDKGENWFVAFPAATVNAGHNLYGGFGRYNHGIVVDPRNNGILYVLGYDLWKLERPTSGHGYYMTSQVTNGGSSTYYEDSYLHVGLHSMVFNPNNPSQCYIGTDGGVFKGVLGSTGFSFSNCNRNYITTRMRSVGMSGKTKRVIAAGLDHGIVLINGDENTNTESHGEWINPTGYNYGAFDNSAHGGPSAISLINPNTIFVTYKGGNIARTETAGEDWVSSNFTSTGISLASSFHTPILLYENFEDQNSIGTVWFKNTKGTQIPAGTTIQCMSVNNYPFDYTLTAPIAAGDSLEIHDPITAKLYVGSSNEIYMTMVPLQFGVETVWYKLSIKNLGFSGTPLSMALSADGDNLFVGTMEGMLYRLSNLNSVVDSITATNSSEEFQVVTDTIDFGGNGQCVTSVAVDPRDANKIIITLGNYGNDNYVYYSTNALADSPTFISKQANLPKMPVYSSVIEMTTGHVIIGTERGIYRTKDINSANWVADGEMMDAVPVMELKQQLVYHAAQTETIISDNDTVVVYYPGVDNKGIIYAATYGRGVFRCENYKLISGDNIPETPAVEMECTVNIFPNPVSTQATVSFEVEGNANVSYQVYDLTGRLVKAENLGRMTDGQYEINVNTSDLSTGSYILRLTQGARSASVKFLVY